jgi:KDO2-lipid IV(A) lauroyltransferase
MALFEMGMAWFMPYWRLQKRFVVKGEEHWNKLKEQGTGALIITIHFTTLEITNVAINRLFNMHMSYKPHKNPVYDLIQRWGRERHNKQSGAIARRDVRGMVKALKKGDWLWYAPDQDYGRKVSEFVPWFGIPTATVAAPPRLLRMAGVPAVAMTYRHLPDYQGYEIEFLPAFEDLPSGDDYADLVRLNQHVEDCVRANPAEYLWVHRRFKTRPTKAEASLYS